MDVNNIELLESLKEVLWDGWILLGVIFIICTLLVIIRSYIPDDMLPIIKGAIALVILGGIFYLGY
ncbi:putative membrane protein [Bacillus wiedmannii]|nr:putative membrane protein [Bacillus wiedmannii]